MTDDGDDNGTNYAQLAAEFQARLPGIDVFPIVGKQPARGVYWNRPHEVDYYDWSEATGFGVVPDGYTVIDFDDAQAMQAFFREHGEAPDTLAVRSPRGLHIYFAGESEHRNGMLKNIDIRSGTKGYIVGPGSVVNGVEYRIVKDTEPASLPEEYRQAITTPRAPLDIVVSGGDFQTIANEVGYNNALLSLKGKLMKMGLDEPLANEMVAAANNLLDDPYPAHKLEQTVLARKSYQVGQFEIEALRPEGGRLTTSAERRLRPPITWLAQDLLPEHGIGQVWAPSMAGKSFAMIDLALCLVNGLPEWAGFDLLSQGSVVYAMSEGSLGFQRRVDAWLEAHPGSVDTGLWDLNAEEFFVDLTSSDGIAELEADVMEAGIEDLRLIILDTQGQLFGSLDENSNSEFNAVAGKLKRLAKRLKCLVLLVHHTGHEGTRARGAAAMRQAMDVEISLSQRGVFKVRKVKEAPATAEGNFVLEPSGESVWWRYTGTLADSANAERDAILARDAEPPAEPFTPVEIAVIQRSLAGLSVAHIQAEVDVSESGVSRARRKWARSQEAGLFTVDSFVDRFGPYIAPGPVND